MLLWLRLYRHSRRGLTELSFSKGPRHFAYSQQIGCYCFKNLGFVIRDVIKGNKSTEINGRCAFYKEMLTECMYGQKYFFTGTGANTGCVEDL